MNEKELAFMMDEEKQRQLRRLLRRVMKRSKLNICEILDIKESCRYYAEKVMLGLCAITPVLAKRIINIERSLT